MGLASLDFQSCPSQDWKGGCFIILTQNLDTQHRPNHSAYWVAHLHTTHCEQDGRHWVCVSVRVRALEKDHSWCDFMISPAVLQAHLLLHTLECTQILVTHSLLSSVIFKVLTCKKQKYMWVGPKAGRLPSQGLALLPCLSQRPPGLCHWPASLHLFGLSSAGWLPWLHSFMFPHEFSMYFALPWHSASSGIHFISLFSSASHSWLAQILDSSSGFTRSIWLLPILGGCLPLIWLVKKSVYGNRRPFWWWLAVEGKSGSHGRISV